MANISESMNGGDGPTHATANSVDLSSSKKIPNLANQPKETKDPKDPLCFPPGFTSAKYREFIAGATKIVGEGNVTVITNAEQLTHEHYIDPSKAHDMHNIVDKTYFVASAVLCPREVPDVQEIMRLCNQFGMPVWPFSIGRK